MKKHKKLKTKKSVKKKKNQKNKSKKISKKAKRKIARRAKSKKVFKKKIRKGLGKETNQKTQDSRDLIGELVSRGKQRGFVTEDEILHVIPDAEKSIEELEKLYENLETLGVRVLSSDEMIRMETDRISEDLEAVIVVVVEQVVTTNQKKESGLMSDSFHLKNIYIKNWMYLLQSCSPLIFTSNNIFMLFVNKSVSIYPNFLPYQTPYILVGNGWIQCSCISAYLYYLIMSTIDITSQFSDKDVIIFKVIVINVTFTTFKS